MPPRIKDPIERLARRLCSKARNRARNQTPNYFMRCEISPLIIKKLLIKQKMRCARTDEFLTSENASVDRIDSWKGYVRGNVQIVTKDYNMCKGELHDDFFLELCQRVVQTATSLTTN